MVDPPGYEQDSAFGERATAPGVHAPEDHNLQSPLEVLESGDRHRLLVAGGHRANGSNHAADHDPLAVERLVLEIARIGCHELGDLIRKRATRWARDRQ